MATFIATTASSGPCLKDAVAAQKVLERYCWDGDVQALIETDGPDGQPHLALYGYDWPGAWKIPDGVSPDEFVPDYDLDSGDGFEDFLRDIAPHLAEPLTVQAIGFEKCRFPLSACEWHVRPDGTTIAINGFQHSHDDAVPPLTGNSSQAATAKEAGGVD